MADSTQGIISFIHHEKNYCTIDYTKDGKKKSINGDISDEKQRVLIKRNVIKKIHKFHLGDTVSFEISMSPRGDKQLADNVVYMFNDALSNLLNQAKDNNEFNGYLKLVGDDYFVKETGSYLFFPVIFSPWELRPPENVLNEPVLFSLENISNPQKVSAKLKRQVYIAEYYKAEQCFKTKNPCPAKVNNISPHSIYLNLFGGKIKAKIPTNTESKKMAGDQPLIIGDRFDVIITFLSPKKIVVEKI